MLTRLRAWWSRVAPLLPAEASRLDELDGAGRRAVSEAARTVTKDPRNAARRPGA